MFPEQSQCSTSSGMPLVPVLSQMHPLHIFTPYLPKFHFNIIFPSTTRSSERFSDNFYVFLISLVHATCPTYLILLDLITLIIFGEVYSTIDYNATALQKYRSE